MTRSQRGCSAAVVDPIPLPFAMRLTPDKSPLLVGEVFMRRVLYLLLFCTILCGCSDRGSKPISTKTNEKLPPEVELSPEEAMKKYRKKP
jgi:hypothetical protein